MSSDRPTFGSLFAGIGGIDLGLERAGWQCRWQVEWDEYCQHVLAHHWPDVPRYGDITAVDWSGIERVDLLAGGFPCQPVSMAGKGLAQDDVRWLWPEFARAIRALRPRFVIVENVPGLRYRGMGDVLEGLAEVGYDAEWDCLPAAAFGAPHIRDRLWIVGHAERRELGIFDRAPGSAGAIPDRPGPSSDVPDARSERRQLSDWREQPAVAFAGSDGGQNGSNERNWWATEPDVGRVAHGIPARVDRLRALGNAVVPQVVEYIGRRILEADGLVMQPDDLTRAGA